MATNSTAAIAAWTQTQTPPRRTFHAFGLVRSAFRGAGFALALFFAAIDYARMICFRSHLDPWRKRAFWLHRWSRIVAGIVGLRLRCHGIAPGAGMIVSNHLSYLDIVAFSALVPCVFVAKQEVASWPIVGLFARMAGTIFVDRARRMEVASVNGAIKSALGQDVVVVLFAEGTSSGGHTVLPFRSSLLEPVTQPGSKVTPAAIQYDLDDGSVSEEVCYWRDMTLLPHLLNVFRKRQVRAGVAFGHVDRDTLLASRKDAARHLQREVAALFKELKHAG